MTDDDATVIKDALSEIWEKLSVRLGAKTVSASVLLG